MAKINSIIYQCYAICSPATLIAVTITLATVAIALFIAHHRHRCCHHPLCCLLLENVLKMQEERAGKIRARDVSRGQVRHRLFLVKTRDRGPLRVMQTRHLKVSKSKTTWPNHVDKRYKRYKKMLTRPKDMRGTRVRATK
jgi:hypothetical protein